MKKIKASALRLAFIGWQAFSKLRAANVFHAAMNDYHVFPSDQHQADMSCYKFLALNTRTKTAQLMILKTPSYNSPVCLTTSIIA